MRYEWNTITIASVVDDMAATLGFYRQLGVSIPADADNDDHVVVDLGDGVRMSWNTVAAERTFNKEWQPPSIPGRMGVTLSYASPEQVDELHRILVEQGHSALLPPFDAPWGGRHCRMLDPDGNGVDLFAQRDPEHT
ncbi:MAG: VOC family protein [Acidimicrobiia bacterium]|nr:VOC family protein [Acidimicrobiia bacterium]